MSTIADPNLAAIDRFVSTIYWSDDDVSFNEAFVDAVDEWTAIVAAEYHESVAFSDVEHPDPMAGALLELIAAVDYLTVAKLRGLTVSRALSEAVVDWRNEP